MAKKVTIKDIARELNTNYSTVSRALNNSSRISDEMKIAVAQQAKLMGYKPNKVAQQLKSGSSNTIGLIVPRINRVFFSGVIDGVEIIAKQNGYNVLICQSYESTDEENRNIQTLLENNVAGIVVSVTRKTQNSSEFDKISQDFPLVMFDRTFENGNFNQVINDNFLGAYQATAHLIEMGYRKIMHFSGPLHLKNYQERLNGYQQALKDKGLQVNDNFIVEDVLTREKGFIAMDNIITSGQTFDAVFAASDFSALGAMLCLQEKQFVIPQDVGICGFANEPFTELIGLTTVEQFSKNIGKLSAELLFEQIREVQTQQKTIKIKPELIIRKSTYKKS